MSEFYPNMCVDSSSGELLIFYKVTHKKYVNKASREEIYNFERAGRNRHPEKTRLGYDFSMNLGAF